VAANLTAAAGAVSYDEARSVVAALLHRRILVGHALRNDLKVLQLDHPVSAIRDTAKYRPLRLFAADDKTPSLKTLAARVLGREIQTRTHDPGEDARTAMDLYHKCQEDWERSVASTRKSAADRMRTRARR
jgi:RNA exonuclease 4